jgi:hypothetical protein
MLRNNHHSVFVALGILLDQVPHRFHQQALPFHVTRVRLPRFGFSTRWIRHFWLDWKGKNFGHADTSRNPNLFRCFLRPVRCNTGRHRMEAETSQQLRFSFG